MNFPIKDDPSWFLWVCSVLFVSFSVWIVLQLRELALRARVKTQLLVVIVLFSFFGWIYVNHVFPLCSPVWQSEVESGPLLCSWTVPLTNSVLYMGCIAYLLFHIYVSVCYNRWWVLTLSHLAFVILYQIDQFALQEQQIAQVFWFVLTLNRNHLVEFLEDVLESAPSNSLLARVTAASSFFVLCLTMVDVHAFGQEAQAFLNVSEWHHQLLLTILAFMILYHFIRVLRLCFVVPMRFTTSKPFSLFRKQAEKKEEQEQEPAEEEQKVVVEEPKVASFLQPRKLPCARKGSITGNFGSFTMY